METNNDYFNNKSEAEKLRNISNMVDGIVNTKPEETLEETPALEEKDEEGKEVNPVVELVGKAISAGRPKGFFMQGVQTDDNPKL